MQRSSSVTAGRSCASPVGATRSPTNVMLVCNRPFYRSCITALGGRSQRLLSPAVVGAVAHRNGGRPFSTDTQPAPQAQERVSFRFWHDEKRFKGTGEQSLVQRALLEQGGIRMGGNVKSHPELGPMGWQKPHHWDLLWSPSSTALKAAAFVRPGQLICTVPGLYSITRKRQLPTTLHKVRRLRPQHDTEEF